MDGRTDQRTVLLLLVGAGETHVASEHPTFGTAVLVGVGVGVVMLPVAYGTGQCRSCNAIDEPLQHDCRSSVRSPS